MCGYFSSSLASMLYTPEPLCSVIWRPPELFRSKIGVLSPRHQDFGGLVRLSKAAVRMNIRAAVRGNWKANLYQWD